MKSKKNTYVSKRMFDWTANCICCVWVNEEKEVLNPYLGEQSDLMHAMTILYSPFILFLLSERIIKVILYTFLHKVLSKFELLLMRLLGVWAHKGWFLIPTFKFCILFPLFHLHASKYLCNSSLFYQAYEQAIAKSYVTYVNLL